MTMLVGVGLVALSIVLMLKVTAGFDPLGRQDLAFALAVILLGLLMMVTRRNAVSQVVGFMSLENGLILAASGARGMPLVVEISIAFSVLIAFIVIGLFLFRIRERFDTVDLYDDSCISRRPAVIEGAAEGLTAIAPFLGVLGTPLIAAAILALVPNYRASAAINALASLLTLIGAVTFLCIETRARHAAVHRRSQHRLHRRQYVRRFHDERLQRDLHRSRNRDRPADVDAHPFLPRDVPGHDVRHEPRARREQHRHDVGRGGTCDIDDGRDGRSVPHARGARSGVEIFHSRQRRHCAGAVRHDARVCRRRCRRSAKGCRRWHGPI